MNSFPRMTAHTGCMGTPDNTLKSIEAGLSCGADILEEDVLVTADGILVLSHDDNVHLADGTECWISQMSYEQLHKLEVKAHNGAPGETMRILPLDALLPYLQKSGVRMNLDLKSDACVEPISAWIEQNQLLEQAFLSGCEKDRAQLVQRVNPRLRKLLNVDPAVFMTDAPYMEVAHQICKDASASACFGLNLNYRVVAPELLPITAEYGLDVCIWTVNEVEEIKHFIQMGVHSITTRNIATLVQIKTDQQI
ncbi:MULTISPECIES: glycerophosphodiester phosphodiesterase [Paenibacillus]|uniref:Glycerophosphodiester phosphodiesterase family protein n=1 Tax=Paenibacillus violae TaxID=3077234 RepID=A0ABU3R810_9BACL|nr:MULTISPECIES: glycerophosphodiester phosphodiesterase family protein [Paenibacillus]MDU0200413.1 glycerophosphodiester phosphodiesterase family protein [Paenibacillus sp. PFR10]MEC0265790.1 glycerophosphodiester phosphodiesterase family protein [Paenibacillus anseongense]